MALQGAVLKPAPNASDFIIYHRDKDGKPYEVYDPEHSISTCVVNSINICRGMLRAPKVRTALMKLAKAFCDERTDTWFCQGHATKEKMAPITDAFLGKVLAGFPYIIVDETLRNPSVMAIHWRHKFIGEFETSNQCIALNGLVSGHRARLHLIDA